jgi:hypothetical protein
MDITLGRRPEKRIPKPPYQLQMKGESGAHIWKETFYLTLVTLTCLGFI